MAVNVAHPAASPAPGERGRREQEGEQPEDVDRRELKALELAGPPPAQDQANEDDHEEDDVERDLQADGDAREIGVPADQQDVGRAVVAPQLVWPCEQHLGDRGDGEDEIAGDDQRAVPAGRQPARREGS